MKKSIEKDAQMSARGQSLWLNRMVQKETKLSKYEGASHEQNLSTGKAQGKGKVGGNKINFKTDVVVSRKVNVTVA